MSGVACHELTLSIRPSGGRASRRVLDHVSLDVAPGELVAIVGPSGSGKSSLLACLAGLDRPDTGQVSALDHELSSLSRRRLAAFRLKHFAVVLQGEHLLGSLSCRQNVDLPRRLRTVRRSLRGPDLSYWALTAVGLKAVADQLPSALSGGERQRVAVARMLATPAAVTLVDEPTTALDTENAETVVDHLRYRAMNGSAVVMVTHDFDAAARADRIVLLVDGRIRAEGSGLDRQQLAEWINRWTGNGVSAVIHSTLAP